MNQMLSHMEEAQGRVSESERKLHHAEKVAKFGHWEFNLDTQKVITSAGARQIYGLGEKELTIPEIQQVPLPQYRSGLDRMLQDLISGNKPYNTEFLIRRQTDNATIAIHSIAEYDPGRNVVFGVIQDITDRKEAENALRESEERYRSLMDNLPEFALVHRDGTILYANANIARAAGRSQEELRGKSIFEFVAPESRAVVIEKGSRLRSTGEPVEPFEVTFQIEGGQKIVGFVNTAIIRFQGEPAFLTIITDITGRKMMEQALSTANRKLHMLSSITRHDIRNKVLGLRAYLSIAMMSAHDAAEAELLSHAEDSARTIDEQLEFTREYQSMGMSAPQWIPGIIDRARAQVNPGDIRIHDECNNLEVLADPLLEKVFYNLFDNAIRYGGKITAIDAGYEKQDAGGIVLFVKDNGIGIPVKDKSDIFERGFGRNTGLGLFMIREILGITGITIRETGIPGEGARFEMLVPEGSYRITGPMADRKQ
jgi:PAS domain S-box-containing protein